MTKKISIIKKREWLKAYEEGRSEASIARGESCDVRTLKKGIQDARLERDATLARSDLIKEALHSHNEKLLELIREIFLVVKLPGPDQAIPWKHKGSSGSIGIEGGRVQYESWPEIKVTNTIMDAEDKPEWELLTEHLKTDRLRQLLGQWKIAFAAHIETRMVIKLKLVNLLQEKSGYQIADKSTDSHFLYSASVDFLFQEEINQLLKPASARNLMENIVAVPDTGRVEHAGLSLARAPGSEEECRQHMLDTLDELRVFAEATSVINTYKVIKDLTARARRAAEEILMLGLVPGHCRICRRLGM